MSSLTNFEGENAPKNEDPYANNAFNEESSSQARPV